MERCRTALLSSNPAGSPPHSGKVKHVDPSTEIVQVLLLRMLKFDILHLCCPRMEWSQASTLEEQTERVQKSGVMRHRPQ